MSRVLIILAALIVLPAVFFVGFGFIAGLLVTMDSFVPSTSPQVRAGVAGVVVLVALGLFVVAIRWRRRRRKDAHRSSPEAFRTTWWTVGLLSAPVAVLAAMSIASIEGAYRNISGITAEMRATLQDLEEIDATETFADLAATTEILTRVRSLTLLGETDLTLPMLDPETDRAYLVDHYELMVSNHLRPHLLARVENQITSNLGKADALYAALKVYLMLGQEAPMDADYVLSWVEADLSERYRGAQFQAFREQVIQHTEALLGSGRWNEYPVRSDLVAEARRQLADIEPSRLLYYRIMSDPITNALQDWRVSDAGGPATARVFMRASGQPLTEPIPGIFTREGFHQVFLPLVSDAAALLERDSWVLGSPAQDLGPNLAETTRRVLDQYYNEYGSRWEGLLRDLSLVPTESRAQLVEVLNLISGPASPARNVLEAAAEETRLTEPLEFGALETAIGVNDSLFASRMARLGKLIQHAVGVEDLAGVPGAAVEERFRWLHDLFDGPNPEIDRYMEHLNDLYRTVSAVTIAGGTATEDIEAASRPLRTMTSLPPLLDTWTLQMLGKLDAQSNAAMRATLNEKWQTEILPFCRKATTGRYPFVRASEVDVPLSDFARIFGPSGLIDTFFNQNLAGMVSQDPDRWRWRSEFGLSETALPMFQRAAEIRDAYFTSGGNLLVPFELAMTELDADAASFTLHLGNDRLYSHRSPSAQVFAWPWPTRSARISMYSDGRSYFIREEGGWAFFRLLDRLQVHKLAWQNAWRLTANIEGRLGTFEIRFLSSVNPYSIGALSGFRCPEGF